MYGFIDGNHEEASAPVTESSLPGLEPELDRAFRMPPPSPSFLEPYCLV
jgi:hypothetical protein